MIYNTLQIINYMGLLTTLCVGIYLVIHETNKALPYTIILLSLIGILIIAVGFKERMIRNEHSEL